MMQHPYYQRERYNELPDAQRNLLDTMDKFISSQTQIKYELRARDASEEMRRLMADVHSLISTQQSLSATLEADTMRLQSVTAKVEKDRHDNAMLHQVATHAKEKMSDGSSFLDWLRRFYENISEEDITRIQRYRLTMEQLERHLISIDQREQFAPQLISDIIRNQNASFMAMAERVATLHAEIETLKKDYLKWYQTRFQSVRDPFAPVAAAADRS
ncbi:glutathionyl-hydroquinone reductase [Malassezia equina]|uniref:Glutathionyl-hydroquinone reductase n=1 Tax=Malassezia equina TaxID=1381935 RepID=A0AAF0ECU8_9BASI|nr:glutathionyl-hydroquinone reductase [Malassezia equina]